MKIFSLLLFVLGFASGLSVWAEDKPPVQFAIYGLSHDHARGFIPLTRGRTDTQLVGIVEPDRELADRYAKNFDLPASLFHPTLADLLKTTNAQCVAIFTSTYDHRRVVEECAGRGLHVMMETARGEHGSRACDRESGGGSENSGDRELRDDVT